MLRLRSIPLGFTLVMSTALLLGCSDDTQSKDLGADLGAPDLPDREAGKPDQIVVKDLNPKDLPRITSMFPNSGFSNQTTPVTLVGQNFAQGMMVYVDGSPVHGTVTVASSASASFTMPVNPYDQTKPYRVMVRVIVKQQSSAEVPFRYVVATPMTESFKGVIMTASLEAKRYIASPVVEGKVLAAAPDAGTLALEGEVGYGPVGSDPSKDNRWRWLSVPFSRKEGEYSVFGGSVRFPLEGDYDLGFRFSKDGGYFIFADKDDTDLAYSPSQAAKLKVTVPPLFYCETKEDCAPYPVRAVCEATQKVCVECLVEGDCSGNPYAYGPKCDVNKTLCYCADDAQCAGNPYGALCNGKPAGYCGCAEDKNCTGGKTCVEDPKTGMKTCGG